MTPSTERNIKVRACLVLSAQLSLGAVKASIQPLLSYKCTNWVANMISPLPFIRLNT